MPTDRSGIIQQTVYDLAKRADLAASTDVAVPFQLWHEGPPPTRPPLEAANYSNRHQNMGTGPVIQAIANASICADRSTLRERDVTD